MSTLTSLLDKKASRTAEQVDDLGRGMAGGLHAAADSIRKGSKAIENVADSAAGKLDGAGSYVEKHTVKRAIAESRQLVRRYPVESLVLAAGVGFLSGLAIRRLTHTCHKSPA
jgi:ElaB/YqjD/DUF883 family membrane-anchored ribosome-binding protein